MQISHHHNCMCIFWMPFYDLLEGHNIDFIMQGDCCTSPPRSKTIICRKMSNIEVIQPPSPDLLKNHDISWKSHSYKVAILKQPEMENQLIQMVILYLHREKNSDLQQLRKVQEVNSASKN